MKVGVDHLLVKRNIGWGRECCGLVSGECSDFVGADGGINGGLNGYGSGEGKHEGGWISEIVGESDSCLGWTVLVGSEDPLLLLLVNDVGEAGGCGDLYWEVGKVMPGGSL